MAGWSVCNYINAILPVLSRSGCETVPVLYRFTILYAGKKGSSSTPVVVYIYIQIIMIIIHKFHVTDRGLHTYRTGIVLYVHIILSCSFSVVPMPVKHVHTYILYACTVQLYVRTRQQQTTDERPTDRPTGQPAPIHHPPLM